MPSQAPHPPSSSSWIPGTPEERPGVLFAFTYFFLLLASYYILQPVRDELGILVGVRKLPWLFMASMVVMALISPVYSGLVRKVPRRILLPRIYVFFVLNLLAFFLPLEFASKEVQVWVAKAFFLWVSVFNLFAVSVFWSFMADLFSSEQGKRLFGFLGAGGTLGQLGGSFLTGILAPRIGSIRLLLVSAFLLSGVVVCIARLLAWEVTQVPDDLVELEAEPEKDKAPAEAGGKESAPPPKPQGSGAWAAWLQVASSRYLQGICLFMFLYTFTSTFLYFSKVSIVATSFESSGERTAFFAGANFAVSALTLLIQVFFTGKVLEKLGLARTLALVPALTCVGFLGLAMAPSLGVLVAFEVARKAGNYALTRPAREILYTVVSREEKYSAKNLIDTFVYRGGDGLAALLFKFLGAGATIAVTASTAIPFSLAWLGVAWALGKSAETSRDKDT